MSKLIILILFIFGIIFNESSGKPPITKPTITKKEEPVVFDIKKNILTGDSQTPFVAKWSTKSCLLNKKGSESALWKGGMGLNWLKTSISNYPKDSTMQSVAFCIVTNGRFSLRDDIKGLVEITKEKFPNAKLFVIKGSWGWGGNINVVESTVNIYYSKFSELGVVVVNPPIGKCSEPHNPNLPQYKEIAKNLDSLLNL
jgi:hypothetical protein